MRNLPQGVTTGLILGALCLIGALGFWIFSPEFSGLIDRHPDETALPVWAVLALLAVFNFAYAGLSYIVARRSNPQDNPPGGTGGEE